MCRRNKQTAFTCTKALAIASSPPFTSSSLFEDDLANKRHCCLTFRVNHHWNHNCVSILYRVEAMSRIDRG